MATSALWILMGIILVCIGAVLKEGIEIRFLSEQDVVPQIVHNIGFGWVTYVLGYILIIGGFISMAIPCAKAIIVQIKSMRTKPTI